MKRNPTSVLLAALLLGACATAPVRPTAAPAASPAPEVLREFRGVWVATVGNIDWPARPGLPVDSQKAQLVAIMDRAAELKLNAVIFQVRTAADALYASEFEPWSEYLTGTQGQAPGYDPLTFAVEAAHARGLELHAWFNPYRARHPSAASPVASTHVSVTRPELVRTYGTHLWLDPGEPAVQEHSINVITDVARRYDVDGIHIDDYFYPYRERDSAGAEIPFPDEASYQRYVAAGGTLERSDWRRHNVDTFVARMHEAVHEVKPYLSFGVSPIGVWRRGPALEACCFDAYEQIYADARKWFAEGTLDYFVPQLYRSMADTLMNYGVMLGWWGEQNQSGRHLYAGLIPNSVRRDSTAQGWPVDEIVGQVYVARGHPAAQGHVHFSARALMRESGLRQRLARSVYRAPALIPAHPWLGISPPAAPRATLANQEGRLLLELAAEGDTPVRVWNVRLRRGERWSAELVPGPQRVFEIPDPGTLTEVRVSAVGRSGSEGPAVTVYPPR